MRKTLLLACAALLVLPALAAAAPAGGPEESALLAGIFTADPGVQEPIALTSDWYMVCGSCSHYSDCTSWCGAGYTGTCHPIRYCTGPDEVFHYSICLCERN